MSRIKTGSSLYHTYQGMKARCTNPKCIGYPWYGAKGVTVCDRWLGKDGFQNFIADMGEKPRGTSLDRIDPCGNYEPSNCRWADNRTQRWNQRPGGRRAPGVTAFGRTQTYDEWSAEFGIARNTLVSRCLNGVPIEDALKMPVESSNRWRPPKGAAVVPIEPTEAMIEAAFAATVWPDLTRATSSDVIAALRENMRKEYRAMIEAAPEIKPNAQR